MSTQTTSKRPAKWKQSTALGESLFRAADEMVAHIKGKIALPVRYLEPVAKVDVLAIRNKLGLSQSEFARQFRINQRALQDWEQGRRKPESAVRAYLKVIENDPKAVERALRKSA